MPADCASGTARRRFREQFGQEPVGAAFAPGRVNVIGEHLDYCGLPVLPFALPEGITLAFRARSDDRIRCGTALRGGGTADFRLGKTAPPPGFGRYLHAAGSGLLAGGWLGEGPTRGFDGFLVSTLPAASGLSSSSALVVAAAHALLAVNRPPGALDEADLPRVALDLAAAERGVAIQGGAMDQSIAIGALPGHALRLAFDPPAWTPIPVDPRRFAFLAVFTGTPADKGGAAGRVFDRRVTEAAAALAGLQRALGESGGYAALLARRPRNRLDRAARALPRPLDSRAVHILGEARRVEQAVAALRSGDAEALGALLDASHESLRRHYEVSTAGLDRLVGTARAHGALGARLTGAGLGGSAVALTTPDRAPALLERLRRDYPVAFPATPSGRAGLRPFPGPGRRSP